MSNDGTHTQKLKAGTATSNILKLQGGVDDSECASTVSRGGGDETETAGTKTPEELHV